MGYPCYTVKSHTPPGAPSPVGQVEDQKGNVRKLTGITLYSNSYNIPVLLTLFWSQIQNKASCKLLWRKINFIPAQISKVRTENLNKSGFQSRKENFIVYASPAVSPG